MTLKRVGSLKNKKHKHCLQCGRVLVGLKDNTEHECSFLRAEAFCRYLRYYPGTYSSRTPGLKTPNRTKEPGRPGSSTEEEKPGRI